MALVERLAHENGFDSIANHQFAAAVYFWAKGDLSRQNVIDMFNLRSEDTAQLDDLATYYNSLTDADKREFKARLEAAGVLLESGLITKSQWKSFLGVTAAL